MQTVCLPYQTNKILTTAIGVLRSSRFLKQFRIINFIKSFRCIQETSVGSTLLLCIILSHTFHGKYAKMSWTFALETKVLIMRKQVLF